MYELLVLFCVRRRYFMWRECCASPLEIVCMRSECTRYSVRKGVVYFIKRAVRAAT